MDIRLNTLIQEGQFPMKVRELATILNLELNMDTILAYLSNNSIVQFVPVCKSGSVFIPLDLLAPDGSKRLKVRDGDHLWVNGYLQLQDSELWITINNELTINNN